MLLAVQPRACCTFMTLTGSAHSVCKYLRYLRNPKVTGGQVCQSRAGVFTIFQVLLIRRVRTRQRMAEVQKTWLESVRLTMLTHDSFAG